MFLCVCAESNAATPLTATEDAPAGIFFVARPSRLTWIEIPFESPDRTPQRERGGARISALSSAQI
jgi:hypothetical protein